MSASQRVPGPREVFEHMQREWLATDSYQFGDLLADDVVIEMPFAPPGRPSRIQGRERFMAFAALQRAALPVRFDEVRNVVIHDTTDPQVIVVEYELAGTVTTIGRQAAAPFIGVLQVHEGKIAHWREYQNVPAITAALQPPTPDHA